jgi:hypothetical protein
MAFPKPNGLASASRHTRIEAASVAPIKTRQLSIRVDAAQELAIKQHATRTRTSTQQIILRAIAKDVEGFILPE